MDVLKLNDSASEMLQKFAGFFMKNWSYFFPCFFHFSFLVYIDIDQGIH